MGHLPQAHTRSAGEPETLRISFDTKAKVKSGPFSRGGVSRGQPAVRAADHDLHPTAVLVPAGILEVAANPRNILFGTSRDTSDFMADVLDGWWQDRRDVYPGVRRRQIDWDNGPEIASSRTQFLKRMVEFSDRQQLTLEFVDYPPYHSQYNSVERCWGIRENHWNGAVLDTVDAALDWARTMTWRGVPPIVPLLDLVYETGVRLTTSRFRPIAARLERSASLPKWSLIIQPNSG